MFHTLCIKSIYQNSNSQFHGMNEFTVQNSLPSTHTYILYSKPKEIIDENNFCHFKTNLKLVQKYNVFFVCSTKTQVFIFEHEQRSYNFCVNKRICKNIFLENKRILINVRQHKYIYIFCVPSSGYENPKTQKNSKTSNK